MAIKAKGRLQNITEKQREKDKLKKASKKRVLKYARMG